MRIGAVVLLSQGTPSGCSPFPLSASQRAVRPLSAASSSRSTTRTELLTTALPSTLDNDPSHPTARHVRLIRRPTATWSALAPGCRRPIAEWHVGDTLPARERLVGSPGRPTPRRGLTKAGRCQLPALDIRGDETAAGELLATLTLGSTHPPWSLSLDARTPIPDPSAFSHEHVFLPHCPPAWRSSDARQPR
jgi:hypothetical protein